MSAVMTHFRRTRGGPKPCGDPKSLVLLKAGIQPGGVIMPHPPSRILLPIVGNRGIEPRASPVRGEDATNTLISE
jgi:hypothetical protein